MVESNLVLLELVRDRSNVELESEVEKILKQGLSNFVVQWTRENDLKVEAVRT